MSDPPLSETINMLNEKTRETDEESTNTAEINESKNLFGNTHSPHHEVANNFSSIQSNDNKSKPVSPNDGDYIRESDECCNVGQRSSFSNRADAACKIQWNVSLDAKKSHQAPDLSTRFASVVSSERKVSFTRIKLFHLALVKLFTSLSFCKYLFRLSKTRKRPKICDLCWAG